MTLSEHTYTSLLVMTAPGPAATKPCETPGHRTNVLQHTRLQVLMVAATVGSVIAGTLFLCTRAWPGQQQAVDHTNLPSVMVKAEAKPTTTKDPNRWAQIKFPISFEGPYSGACPYGFNCTGYSRVCEHPPLQHSCNHPGIGNVDGKKYLLVGNDEDSATATSVPFYLPSKIQSISWLRSGGSDAPSGVSVRLVGSGKVICQLHGGDDTNVFFEEVCDSLADYESKPVYICIVNTHTGIWSKVLIDNIHLKDQWGESLDHAGHVHLSPTSRLDCPES